MQNRGSGASDMHGKAARVAESEAGAERIKVENGKGRLERFPCF